MIEREQTPYLNSSYKSYIVVQCHVVICTVLDTACLIMLCVLPGVYWIQPVCLCTVEYCSHYSLVYTYSVPSYSYIRNGSTTTTLHDMYDEHAQMFKSNNYFLKLMKLKLIVNCTYKMFECVCMIAKYDIAPFKRLICAVKLIY